MKELFADASAGITGLIIFFVFFVGVVLWVYRPNAKKTYKDYGEIPFQEDEANERRER